MGGGAELPPQDSHESELWSARKSEVLRERNGATLKSLRHSPSCPLTTAVVVIDGMTWRRGMWYCRTTKTLEIEVNNPNHFVIPSGFSHEESAVAEQIQIPHHYSVRK